MSELIPIQFKQITPSLKQADRLELELRTAKTAADIFKISATAQGMQKVFAALKDKFGQHKSVADRYGEIWIEAECRLAREVEALEKRLGKNTGTRSQLKGKENGVNSSGKGKLRTPDELKSQAPTQKELGLDKDRIQRNRKLEGLGNTKRKELINDLKKRGKGVSPNAIAAVERKQQKEQKRENTAKAMFSRKGPFGTIVMDPPWDVKKGDREARPNQHAFDYPTMSTDEIVELWKNILEKKTTDDCHLFMWTTQKYLSDSLYLLKEFGFRYAFTMVWHKPGGFQPMDLPQFNCEFIVYGRKGTPIFIDTKNFKCCFDAPRQEHSRKPQIFYETIKRVTGGSRLDIFAREKHKGFAQYGNEINEFNGK